MKILKAIKHLFLYNVPLLLSILILLSGSLLLIGGIYPQNQLVSDFLIRVFSRKIVFLSKYITNVLAILLMVMSYGIFKKMRRAWTLSIISLIAADAFLLLNRMNYVESMVVALVLIATIFSKDYFYRSGSMLKMKVSKTWITSFILILFVLIIKGLVFYKEVSYSSSLWWNFTHHFDASVFLHTALIASLVLLYYLGILFFKPFEGEVGGMSGDKDDIKAVLSKFSSSRGYFALLDDKKYLFNDTKEGFIMYGSTSKNYISLGDPICAERSIPSLIEEFNTLGRISDKNIAFYEVGEKYLKYYLNLGLKIIKIGEEAVIDLPSFTLEGPKNKKIRYINSKLSKMGLRFEIIDDFRPVAPRLKKISDEWLKNKRVQEKQFSLGKFDEEYLSNFPIALIYYKDEIVAFSNLLLTEDKEDMSIDLMRYSEGAPANTMDFLFIQIMLWAKEKDVKKFSLGMAPLAGIEGNLYATAWNRYAGFIYENSDTFYNFAGLRRFKDKFSPEWNSKYIAYSGNFNLVFLLKDITSLISGGFLKAFKK